MKISIAMTLALGLSFASNAQTLGKIATAGKTAASKVTGTSSSSLTNEEVVQGLKEALTTGAKTAASAAGATDGFYKNDKIFISWPSEATKMKEKLVSLGMQSQVTQFEESMNRAAEEAAQSAYEVFATAITGMSLTDGFAILNGSDTSATHYLREKTTASLTEKFTPIVKAAMAKVKVTEYWTPLVTAYNKIPLVTKQNPDLEAYVTAKAINGLMLLISEQETKIRTDASAQVTDLLKKVFGSKN